MGTEGDEVENVADIKQLLEQTTAALEWKPSPPRGRYNLTAHDSDDEMQREEEKLLDSAEKLRRLMGECTLSDDEEQQHDETGEEDRFVIRPKRDNNTSSHDSSFMPEGFNLHELHWHCQAKEDDDDENSIAEGGGESQTSPLPREGGRKPGDEELDGEIAAAPLPLQDAIPSPDDRSIRSPPARAKDEMRSPREVTIPSDPHEDMHEVGCAAERLSEAGLLKRYSGFRSVAEDLSADGTSSSSSTSSTGPTNAPNTVCRHIATCILRPDALCGSITEKLVEVAQSQNLVVSKRQGSHVVAEVPAEATGLPEWRTIDMQIGIDREPRDRVLLVRFITKLSASSPSNSSSSAAEAEQRRRRPRTRRFVEALRETLFGAHLNKHALEKVAGDLQTIVLDPQYLCQLEQLAREDMRTNLEIGIQGLENYAKGVETKCNHVTTLLQPMFQMYKMELSPQVKPQPLSAYPLDLAKASQGKGGKRSPTICLEEEAESGNGVEETKGSKKEEGGRGQQSSLSSTVAPSGVGAEEKNEIRNGLDCVEVLKGKAWSIYLRQCDSEMTAKMQQKNLQVIDRLIRAYDYQHGLLQCLRDNRHLMSIPLYKAFKAQTASEEGLAGHNGDVEAPLYYCRCLIGGARPSTFYITYWHCIFMSRLPGLSFTRTIHFRDIKSAEVISLRLGIVTLRAVQIIVPPSTSPRKEILARANGGGEAPISRMREDRERLMFTTTTSPEKIAELIKVLIALHGDRETHCSDEITDYLESLTTINPKGIRPNIP